MQDKDFVRAALQAVALMLASIALGGCLEQAKSNDSFGGSPDDPSGNAPPTIAGNPSRSVIVGNMYSFTPNASDSNNDPLTFSVENSPRWASFDAVRGQLQGQPTLGDVGMYRDILISVSDGTASASLPRFDISVDQSGNFSTTLSWTPPTENDDGSALMDLAGYKIYWGTTPGVYTNSVTLNNPGLTSYVVDNLAAGTYEFVATSFNSSGVESMYSNSAMRTLP